MEYRCEGMYCVRRDLRSLQVRVRVKPRDVNFAGGTVCKATDRLGALPVKCEDIIMVLAKRYLFLLPKTGTQSIWRTTAGVWQRKFTSGNHNL